MKAALVLIAILVVAGLILYAHDRATRAKFKAANPDADPAGRIPILSSHTPEAEEQGICCGMHLTCEKDSLSTGMATEVVYYDDEELDRYANRDPQTYSPEETEEFRDVLLTLLPQDIAGWARSLQLRAIEMPPEVRDELLMIVAEARMARAAAS